MHGCSIVAIDDMNTILRTRDMQAYDEHFRRNWHTVRMLAFDDSSPANHEKYYSTLE